MYLGTRKGWDEELALKCIKKSKLQFSAVAGQLLENEIRLWQGVRDEGSVRCYGSYELPEQVVLVTEVCAGGCLLDKIAEIDHFTEEHARSISRQVAAAIVHLHSLGIAHRDIKPENVPCDIQTSRQKWRSISRPSASLRLSAAGAVHRPRAAPAGARQAVRLRRSNLPPKPAI